MSRPEVPTPRTGDEFELGGVRLSDLGPDQAAALVCDAARSGTPLAVHLCNAYTVTLANRDRTYAEVMSQSSLNLIDGTPITWYQRLLTGRPSRGPVRGPSFMRRLLNEPGLRHYLYGGTADTLDRLMQEIAEAHPVASVVGSHAPPFGDWTPEDLHFLVTELKRTDAQVVWVGLGTPKQDIVLPQVAESRSVVAIGVGAAFDFLSGEKKEAPSFLHNTGLEWIHRLATEPGRLWRRYLLGNAAFLAMAARQLVASRQESRQ